MTKIKVKKIIWDDWNREHIKKHNVTQSEVETVARNFITHARAKEGRYSLFGRSGTRMLTIIIRREEPGEYYVVSARDSAKKERQNVYKKENKKTS